MSRYVSRYVCMSMYVSRCVIRYVSRYVCVRVGEYESRCVCV